MPVCTLGISHLIRHPAVSNCCTSLFALDANYPSLITNFFDLPVTSVRYVLYQFEFSYSTLLLNHAQFFSSSFYSLNILKRLRCCFCLRVPSSILNSVADWHQATHDGWVRGWGGWCCLGRGSRPTGGTPRAWSWRELWGVGTKSKPNSIRQVYSTRDENSEATDENGNWSFLTSSESTEEN